MKRWVVVDWDQRRVFDEAYETKRDAWRATVAEATKQNRSAYEFDQLEVDIEAK